MNDRICSMVALKDFPFEGRDLRTGDTFQASPVDAEYLRRHRKAEYARSAAAPAAAPTPVIPPLPHSTEQASDAVAAGTSHANDSPAAPAAAGSDASAAPAPARKRASPRKKQSAA